jgi:hypothetical protein
MSKVLVEVAHSRESGDARKAVSGFESQIQKYGV